MKQKELLPEQLRINKAIALSGLTSRRKAEELIKSGKVKVNGKVVRELGLKISRTDSLEVDNKKISLKSHTSTYILMNKPKGYVVSNSDEKGRKTIYDLLPDEYKSLKYAGRLDKDSEGLIILSNDGDFINNITHPNIGIKNNFTSFFHNVSCVLF